MKIRDVKPTDEEWVKHIFDSYKNFLGGFGPVWFRYWQNDNPREKWVVIPDRAFAHYLIKKNGEVTLYEIAVHPAYKRMGLGDVLIKAMPTPIELKTDHDNEVSNAFYKRLGFRLMGKKPSKSGKRYFHIWKKF